MNDLVSEEIRISKKLEKARHDLIKQLKDLEVSSEQIAEEKRALAGKKIEEYRAARREDAETKATAEKERVKKRISRALDPAKLSKLVDGLCSELLNARGGVS